jgi:hypothetical protein
MIVTLLIHRNGRNTLDSGENVKRTTKRGKLYFGCRQLECWQVAVLVTKTNILFPFVFLFLPLLGFLKLTLLLFK